MSAHPDISDVSGAHLRSRNRNGKISRFLIRKVPDRTRRHCGHTKSVHACAMEQKRRWIMPIVSVAMLAVGFVILFQNMPAVYYAACAIGFPNATLPEMLALKDVGCAILEEKRAYSGMVMIGGEAAAFHTETGEYASFHCPKDGCGENLERQLSINSSASCPHSRAAAGIAYAEIEGWMASYPRNFGHLGAFPNDFFASQIIKVGPPPPSFILQIEKKLQEHDACT